MNKEYNVAHLGQVFTPANIVEQMLLLRRNFGTVLEPSAGNGAFCETIPNCVSIEIDANFCGQNTLNMDFFDYPTSYTFDTIIGNPPYVRYKDILPETKQKLPTALFDERSNLYLFFIEKCIRHLNPKGELIFITPRDFLKATSSIRLNTFIYEQGTITDIIELGDKRIFSGYNPNTIIWRFEKDNFTRKTNKSKNFILCNGQLLFTDNDYPVKFKDLFFVKVGAVSGNDKIFTHEEFGNMDFVCSHTHKTGKTRRMIFNEKHPYLEAYKDVLIQRKIKEFDEDNWWEWGRKHHISDSPRIYVNSKTRTEKPFFMHSCKNYDGSILAIFPKQSEQNIELLCDKLNAVHWSELGFVCDGRYIFSQKSLENCLLPDFFMEHVPQKVALSL